MKAKEKKTNDELRPEYNFDYSKAVRGKYYKRILKEGANVVILEPDVAKIFIDSDAVNNALRSLLDITRTTQRLTKHSSKRAISCKTPALLEKVRLKPTKHFSKQTVSRSKFHRYT